MSDDKQRPRTLWTETLLDILVTAVERGKEKETRYILREISARGYRKAEVLEFANERLEAKKVQHLEAVIKSMRKPKRKAG